MIDNIKLPNECGRRRIDLRLPRKAPDDAISQQDGKIGFSLYLDREQWGAVVNGLMLERENSLRRKAVNPDSNSNHIAEMCATVIAEINAVSTITFNQLQVPPPVTPTTAVKDAEPVKDDEWVQCYLYALRDEAKRRGGMFPQTSEEQDDDSKAIFRVADMVRFYGQQGYPKQDAIAKLQALRERNRK